MEIIKPEIVVAHQFNRGIGYLNKLPWRIPEDMRRFKQLTMGNAVVMGRKTFESLGKPLPGRTNVVLSRFAVCSEEPNLWYRRSLEESIREIAQRKVGRAFIIGGSEIYALALPLVETIHLTLVHADEPCDTFFPKYDDVKWERVNDSDHRVPGQTLRCQFVTLKKSNCCH